MPAGRPSDYTTEIASRICSLLAAGVSLRAICRADEMPTRQTVSNWLTRHEEFFAQYTKARDAGLDVMADEIIEIADEGTGDAVRDRLRFDARRWYLSKLAPKRYGERLAAEITGPNGGPIETKPSDRDIAMTIARMLSRATDKPTETG